MCENGDNFILLEQKQSKNKNCEFGPEKTGNFNKTSDHSKQMNDKRPNNLQVDRNLKQFFLINAIFILSPKN
jgi:hypothetical protein